MGILTVLKLGMPYILILERMINKKTTLILGAGASKPYGFPTGQELRSKIIKEASTRLRGLTKGSIQEGDYFETGVMFARQFENSGVTSIDKFLNMQNPSYINLGKILIMAFIRDHEKHSKFNENIDHPEQDWYRIFWNKLISGVEKFEDLTFENFQVVTFNYDRSFEFYLYLTVRNLFPKKNVSDKQVTSLMKTLNIKHVFGRVENMIWDNGDSFDEANVLRYYNNLHYDFRTLLDKINEINIINEVKKDTSEFKEIIENSEDVFFLGFGFLEENMKLLGAPFDKKSSIQTRYLATALQFSKENILRYTLKYFRGGGGMNILIDCDCATLLRNHLDS